MTEVVPEGLCPMCWTPLHEGGCPNTEKWRNNTSARIQQNPAFDRDPEVLAQEAEARKKARDWTDEQCQGIFNQNLSDGAQTTSST